MGYPLAILAIGNFFQWFRHLCRAQSQPPPDFDIQPTTQHDTETIGNGITPIHMPSRHEMLMDFIKNTVDHTDADRQQEQ